MGNVLRKCPHCGIEATNELELELFRKHKQSKYGRDTICKECHKKSENERYHRLYSGTKSQKESSRRSRAKNVYGTTLENYDKIMNNATHCECCGSTNKLCYDHDHDTMQFRGILCWDCNSGIGKLGDSVEGVRQALVYLVKHYSPSTVDKISEFKQEYMINE